MVDLSLKKPFNEALIDTANNHANNFQQAMAKGIPCHVTKINKDIVTVAFETNNGVWSMPTMEMPQAFSAYAREPTQVGDKGSAVPADYYLGGVSGLGGGKTTFAPKGNLTPLVFHPLSKKDSETRDYDQYTVTGGKNGVKLIQGLKPKSQTAPPQVNPVPVRRIRGLSTASRRAWQLSRRALRDSSSGNGSSSDADKRATIEINNKGVITHLGKDQKHSAIIDSDSKKIALNVPAGEQGHTVYLGGPGKDDSLYDFIVTGKGPSVNVKAKYKKQDEDQQSDGG